MNECFNCGVSGKRVRLFDAISGKGIVKICRECVSKENIPIIKKPAEVFTPLILNNDLKKRGETVYEKVSRMSGFDSRDKKFEEEKESSKKQETTLKDIADKNFRTQINEELGSRSDLVDNFHWIIMRARRLKHLTQEQLAKAIVEPEAAIKMAEKGILPKENKFVSKLENYLGIKLVKKEFTEKIEEKPKGISFDSATTKNLTISDLQEMKKRREEKILGESAKVSENIEEIEDKTEKEDLSQDENDLIF